MAVRPPIVFVSGRPSLLSSADNLPGLPLGGATGQVLTKASAADNDTAWQTPSGGSGSYNPALGWAY